MRPSVLFNSAVAPRGVSGLKNLIFSRLAFTGSLLPAASAGSPPASLYRAVAPKRGLRKGGATKRVRGISAAAMSGIEAIAVYSPTGS